MRPGHNTESIKQTFRCLAEHYVDDLEGRQMMIKHFPIKCRVVKPKQKQKQRPIKRKENIFTLCCRSSKLWSLKSAYFDL